jgi:hypothetical protein
MKYQVIATMPTTGEVLLIENTDTLEQAEIVARAFKTSLKSDWQVDIVPQNVVLIGKPFDRPGNDFADTMKANADRQEKLKQERIKDNKSVLKSYRIKP